METFLTRIILILFLFPACLAAEDIFLPSCERTKQIHYLASEVRCNLILAVQRGRVVQKFPAFRAKAGGDTEKIIERYFKGKPFSWELDKRRNVMVVKDIRLSVVENVLDVTLEDISFSLPLDEVSTGNLGFPKNIAVQFDVKTGDGKSTKRIVVKEGDFLEIGFDKVTTTKVQIKAEKDRIHSLDFFKALLTRLESTALEWVYFPSDNMHILTLRDLFSSATIGFDGIKSILNNKDAFTTISFRGDHRNVSDPDELASEALEKYESQLLDYLETSEYFVRNIEDEELFYTADAFWSALYDQKQKSVHDFLWRTFWKIKDNNYRELLIKGRQIPDNEVFGGRYKEEWRRLKQKYPKLYKLYKKSRKEK